MSCQCVIVSGHVLKPCEFHENLRDKRMLNLDCDFVGRPVFVLKRVGDKVSLERRLK